jgi:hypothetical protein
MEIKQATPVVVTKKAAREQIESALRNLSELQAVLGKKKFNRRVKKAGKLLSDGLPKSVTKKKQKQKTERAVEISAQ